MNDGIDFSRNNSIYAKLSPTSRYLGHSTKAPISLTTLCRKGGWKRADAWGCEKNVRLRRRSDSATEVWQNEPPDANTGWRNIAVGAWGGEALRLGSLLHSHRATKTTSAVVYTARAPEELTALRGWGQSVGHCCRRFKGGRMYCVSMVFVRYCRRHAAERFNESAVARAALRWSAQYSRRMNSATVCNAPFLRRRYVTAPRRPGRTPASLRGGR